MSTLEINLIQRDASSFRKLSFLEEQLKRVAWIALGALFVGGVGIASSFFIFRAQLTSQEARKIELTRQINVQSPKEGILLSLKERTGVADKALKAAKPWGRVFGILSEISPAKQYSSLSIDDSGRVSTILSLETLDEAVTTVANTIALADEQVLRSPQLQSFAFRDDGTVQISLLFQPVF